MGIKDYTGGPQESEEGERRFNEAITRASRENLRRNLKLPASFTDPQDEVVQDHIHREYAGLNQRQQALVDCARIACQRLKDTFNGAGMAADGDWKNHLQGQMAESFIIFERIKDLDETIDWNGLGLMMSDDPRIKNNAR